MDLANSLLDRVEGRKVRTFGNTCHNGQLGPDSSPTPLEDLVLPRFLAARGTVRELGESIDPADTSLRNLGTLPCDSYDISQILPAIEQCIERGHWLILTFHHIEQERDRLVFPAAEHEELLEFCARYREDLWVAPVRDVVATLG